MEFNIANKKSDYIWINGKATKWEESYVHVLTHSMHYAGSVYEGLRAYNGKIFKLKEHTQRLIKSAHLIGLEVNYSEEEINDACYEVLKINKFTDAYIRPLLWRGPSELKLYSDNFDYNLMVAAQESAPVYKNGAKLVLSKWRKNAPNAMPPQSKSAAHYAILSLALKQACDAGYDDALLLDQEGFIAECTTTNIFFGKNNDLYTPIADNFLNGITRQTVIELSRNLGINVIETRIKLEDIEGFDSCFKTGTAAEIAGVESISYNGQRTSFSRMDLIIKLQSEFAKLTGKKI